MLDSLIVSEGIPSGAATGAAFAAAAGAAMPGFAVAISALTMRPLGPDPLMLARSTPCACAMRRASGVAFTRSPDAAGAAAGTAAFAATSGSALGAGDEAHGKC